MKTVIELAQHARQSGKYKGGYVIIFNGEQAGWANALNDPQHWAPGCVAVDEHGNQWVARGGNAYDGAESWEPFGQAA